MPHASHSLATKPVSLRRAISTDPGRADCCPWVADNRVCSAIEDTTSTVQYELVPATRAKLHLRATKATNKLEKLTTLKHVIIHVTAINKGEHIGEAGFGIRAVVREIFGLFVFIGEALERTNCLSIVP